MMSLINYNLLPTSSFIFDRRSSKSIIVGPSSSLLPTSSNRRNDSILSASVASTASTLYPHVDNGYLKSNDFTEQGITFTDIGDGNTVVKMSLENKTSAKFMLPSGLVTSFKPEMWHGGTMELLHTCVSKGNDGIGRAVIRGGLSLSLGYEVDSWSSSNNSWTLNRVIGDPKESIQVELISEEKGVELKHAITLGPDVLTSEVIVSNTSDTKSVSLRGSVLCHLMVSTPDATYALGLEGTDFSITKPLTENFSIVPPDFVKKNDGNNPGNFFSLGKLFSRGNKNAHGGDDENLESEAVEEEDDGYKHLAGKISRIYTNVPRRLTIMDRGRRNSVVVCRERDGFSEVYLFSPGSGHEMYGEYSYVCVGNAAVLEPIVVEAQSEWRGGMVLLNPNS